MNPDIRPRYTPEELAYVKAHCRDSPKEVSAALNRSYGSVQRLMTQFKKGTYQKRAHPPHKYYAIYLRETDELVCAGSSKECQEQLGMSKSTFHALVCKTRKGMLKKWDVYVEPYNENLE